MEPSERQNRAGDFINSHRPGISLLLRIVSSNRRSHPTRSRRHIPNCRMIRSSPLSVSAPLAWHREQSPLFLHTLLSCRRKDD